MAAALDDRALRQALAPFIAPSNGRAWLSFLATLAVYTVAVSVAGFSAAPLWLRLIASVAAGLTISSLFVIGHDAAHGAYTASRRINGVIGRVVFLPSLHNYSLWQIIHNRLHHRLPNLQGINSWSPLSPEEYRALSPVRRARERLYRSILGFAPYYLIERWWRDKFMPRRHSPPEHRPAQWCDFAVLCLYLVFFLGALAWVGGALAILLGFVLPFLVWNGMMGATTYLQHTNRRVPWYQSVSAWREQVRDESVTIHLQVPAWYAAISHHIMDHPAHHFQPKIPLYRLAAAQARLNEILGERAVIERFSPGYLFGTLRSCKLYDFEAQRWLDFSGRPAADRTARGADRRKEPVLA